MSSEKEKAIDKIKKLLRMRRGGTPGEIETALCTKLDEERKQQEDEAGLIFIGRQVALRKEYMGAHFGRLKEYSTAPDGDAEAAKYAGYVAGRATEIRSGIGSSGRATLLLS
jgi:hypothetical protein